MNEERTPEDLIDQLRELAEAGEWAKALALFAALHPADLAEVALELDDAARRDLLDHLPTDVTAEALAFLDEDGLAAFAAAIDTSALLAVLNEVPDEVATDVLQQLEPERQRDLLAALDREEHIAALLAYPDESAGGIMRSGFVSLNEGLPVERAIETLRRLRPPSDRAYYLYTVDGDQRLQGVVSVRDLIVAAPGTPLADIAERDVHAVGVDIDREEVARTLQRYNLLAIPVVDAGGRLVGATTADDVIDVLAEEATEDMYRMVGLDEDERVFSPVRTSVRRRLPWMLVNLLWAFGAAAIVSLFDDTLARFTLLAALMPVVAGQGGNAGAQTATIAVRSIAIGDLDVRDVFRATRKEIVVGLANGIAIGVVAGAAVYGWDRNIALSAVLAGALAGSIALATLLGVVIPLGLKWRGVDPALAANIFVTGATDILSFVLFLGLAALVIERIA